MKNKYLTTSIMSLVGTLTYVLVKYLLTKKFDLLSTIVFAIVIWLAYFIGLKYSKQ